MVAMPFTVEMSVTYYQPEAAVEKVCLLVTEGVAGLGG
jgi:hypothetical protein